MVGQISDANILREISSGQPRPQTPPASPSVPDKQSNLRPEKRVQQLQPTVERLISRSLPSDTKLEIEQDKETGAFIYRSVDPKTGEVVSQWPPEQLLRLREALREVQGMLLDTEV